MPTEFKLQRNPKYKDLYGDDDGKYPDLQNLPYVDEKRNEVLDKKPEKPNYRQYAEQGQNPLFAYMEQNMNPEYDKKRDIQLQRTAAVNTLGELIRNVIDLHYGKKGATISKRKPQNNAYAELLGIRDKYEQDQDNYEKMYLNALMNDYNLQNKRDAELGERKWRENFLEKEYNKRDELSDKEFGRRDVLDEAQHKRALAEIQARNKGDIDKVYATRESKNNDDALSFDFNGKKHILTNDQQNRILYELVTLYDNGVINDPAIREYARGDKTGSGLADRLINQYWDILYTPKDGKFIPKKDTVNRVTNNGLYDDDVIDEYKKNNNKPKNDPLNLFD